MRKRRTAAEDAALVLDLERQLAEAQGKLEVLSRRVHHKEEHPWSFEDCMRADCSEARAALDAILSTGGKGD